MHEELNMEGATHVSVSGDKTDRIVCSRIHRRWDRDKKTDVMENITNIMSQEMRDVKSSKSWKQRRRLNIANLKALQEKTPHYCQFIETDGRMLRTIREYTVPRDDVERDRGATRTNWRHEKMIVWLERRTTTSSTFWTAPRTWKRSKTNHSSDIDWRAYMKFLRWRERNYSLSCILHLVDTSRGRSGSLATAAVAEMGVNTTMRPNFSGKFNSRKDYWSRRRRVMNCISSSEEDCWVEFDSEAGNLDVLLPFSFSMCDLIIRRDPFDLFTSSSSWWLKWSENIIDDPGRLDSESVHINLHATHWE